MNVINSIEFSDGRDVQLINEIKKELRFFPSIDEFHLVDFSVDRLPNATYEVCIDLTINDGMLCTYQYQTEIDDVYLDNLPWRQREIILASIQSDDFKEFLTYILEENE
jgi:hypothetical protein